MATKPKTINEKDFDNNRCSEDDQSGCPYYGDSKKATPVKKEDNCKTKKSCKKK